jgi:osmotically-inducible protein OsmY
MKTDREIQERVLNALEWEPSVDAAQIGVTVKDGVATLRGPVTTLHQKYMAERAVRHVFGVRAVADDLEVSPDGATTRSDSAIAEAAANALEWDSAVPQSGVKATVHGGWVTLTGLVDWQYQKAAAETCVRRLYGVKGVLDSISVKPHASASDVKLKIESAFKRSAEIDSSKISVETRDGAIVLKGTVRSLVERDEAERAAWAAPGVTNVDDRLMVVP